jgi:hypothetical protein
MSDCWGCAYRRYYPRTEMDPGEEWCDKHQEDNFDKENCGDYYSKADAKADAKYGREDRY